MKFEERLADLEGIVEKIEGEELPLEDALELFEKGVALVRDLTKQLDDVERRLEVLVRTDDGGLETRAADGSERED